MLVRVILVVFIFSILAGCSTSSKKQSAQSQPEVSQRTYEQESYYQDYDNSWLSNSYVKPAQKTSSGATIQLSSKQIQQALKNAGFYLGSIDGKIGPKTKAAIIRFQKANGLKPDGIVGKKTSAQLNKYLSR